MTVGSVDLDRLLAFRLLISEVLGLLDAFLDLIGMLSSQIFRLGEQDRQRQVGCLAVRKAATVRRDLPGLRRGKNANLGGERGQHTWGPLLSRVWSNPQ